MNQLTEILAILGYSIRPLGFIVLGFGIARFTMDAYKQAVWQVQVALVLGFFFLLVGLTNYAGPASIGAFALGAGVAIILSGMTKKEAEEPK